MLPYTRANIKELAREIVMASTTVTGVQAKLSLDITRGHAGEPQRFTIVGLWGRFILKPQTDRFANLPENEDLTMHLAEAAGIKTVPHSLIRFADGELCYITRRVDRTKNGDKIAMEDMCQLSERLTEDKYKGSYERIAKLIKQYSAAPLLDVVNFWEVVVFSWLTGNADMHLKNFSLYRPADNYMLTPAYDLLSTSIVMPEDEEELALTLNGKKKKIKRADFEKAMLDSGMDEKAIEKLFKKFAKTLPKWYALIEESFLPKDMIVAYREKLNTMSARLGLL
jgi:serine/threonine-protein kinase HipA